MKIITIVNLNIITGKLDLVAQSAVNDDYPTKTITKLHEKCGQLGYFLFVGESSPIDEVIEYIKEELSEI